VQSFFPILKAQNFWEFLGIIILDRKLTGKNHFQYLIRKGSALIDILSALSET